MRTINYNHETHETASIRPLFYRFAADSALVTRWPSKERRVGGWVDELLMLVVRAISEMSAKTRFKSDVDVRHRSFLVERK